MIGKTISHYKILEKLGGGGMGIVYKAEDTKLKRMVALKFLPPHVSLDNEAKERFMHEAQAASALDHNNICTIYEIGESEDGQMYMAMALYEGETLQDKIERGPLPLEEALNIATQIAEGLAKAHERDILHRDIKPANIMITSDGVAKILDFGLAKLSGRTKLTKEGTTLGTVAYMSPEQVRGEAVDKRTDIWALGVILYEMIAGKSPFEADYEQAIMYSIVNEEPHPPTALRTDMPMELEHVVKKCLQKNPVNRYQHSEELIVDLGRIKAQSGSGEKNVSKLAKWKWRNWHLIAGAAMIVVILLVLFSPRSKTPKEGILETPKKESSPEWQNSIAVLPFKNISADKEQEYFCDGMTEQLITNLSSLPSVKVIANASVMHFKNSNETVQQIASELGVAHILEGSV
jgi:serine/threonine protein kinase